MDSQHLPPFPPCPIPETHRRLREAHLLWHQALDSYQSPERFRANLNAVVQALRNITWILQSEKHVFLDFDVWYKPWQSSMAAQADMVWLKNARNIVVKQRDLNAQSKATITLATWRDDALSEVNVPPDAPPEDLIRSLSRVELARARSLPPGDAAAAAVMIERRWVLPDTGGREVLEVLATVYSALSDLVLDGHVVLGIPQCAAGATDHGDFNSQRHASRMLPCMAFGRERRIHRFDLGGNELRPTISTIPAANPSLAEARYGLGDEPRESTLEALDPVGLAQRLLHRAKRMLAKDRSLQRVIFLRGADGQWSAVSVHARDRTEKNVLIRLLANHVASVSSDALIDIGEAWTGAPITGDTATGSSSERLGRDEAIYMCVATRDGIVREYVTPFTRGPMGGIKLGTTAELDEIRSYYLEPIFDVWRRDGFARRSDGKAVLRLWKTDPLDTCYCGRPELFSVCCAPVIEEELDQPSESATAALKSGDLVRAERLARASLAQYVIWLKQHTAATRHVASDLHVKLLEIDIPAIDAHISTFRAAQEMLGGRESVIDELVKVGRLTGVPEVGARVVARAVEWSADLGDAGGATRLLQTLGEPRNLKDILAANLAVRLLRLSERDSLEMFSNVARHAAVPADRWLASMEVARLRHELAEDVMALAELDKLVAALPDDAEHKTLRADAALLRFTISSKEDDFHTARDLLTGGDRPDPRHRLPSLLIDHGDYDEAEAMLKEASTKGDLVAQLLTIDALLRTGRSSAAREVLLSIPADAAGGSMAFPYSYTVGLVSLVSGDPELQRLAISKLRAIESSRVEVNRSTREMLNALEGGREWRRAAKPLDAIRKWILESISRPRR
jgi:hypothetical protein